MNAVIHGTYVPRHDRRTLMFLGAGGALRFWLVRASLSAEPLSLPAEGEARPHDTNGCLRSLRGSSAVATDRARAGCGGPEPG